MEETVDELFPTTPDAVRAILAEVRRIVRATVPRRPRSSFMGRWDTVRTVPA